MPRSSTSFKKRQKELARLEKQRDKAEKRAIRKEDKQTGGSNLDDAIDYSASIYDFIPDEYNPALEEEEAETAAAEKES
jgi:hypothetical protein